MGELYMSEVYQRTEKGALLLDKKWPGWASEISRRKLNLDDEDWCILGQLFGNYNTGLKRVRPFLWRWGHLFNQWGWTHFGGPAEYGFCFFTSDSDNTWTLLRTAWRWQIHKRTFKPFSVRRTIKLATVLR